MLDREMIILDNIEIAPSYFLLRLSSPQIAQNSLPGQFLHIRCSLNNNPLLRRPFSIHRVIGKNTIEILYKVIGKGTHELSKRKKGEKIDCIGPLGNRFKLPKTDNLKPKTPKESYTQTLRSYRTELLIVAGGIGIASLIYLIEKCKVQIGNCKIVAFLGAKTKDDILCTKKLKSLDTEIHISTEDGSMGYKGMVSTLLKKRLSVIGLRFANTTVYTCGPKGMLKEVALISKEHKIPCQVSFEQFMGCGIGICNACVIRTKQGYKKVCKDGPVFNAEEIDWDKI